MHPLAAAKEERLEGVWRGKLSWNVCGVRAYGVRNEVHSNADIMSVKMQQAAV